MIKELLIGNIGVWAITRTVILIVLAVAIIVKWRKERKTS
jgi:hypothetical protein